MKLRNVGSRGALGVLVGLSALLAAALPPGRAVHAASLAGPFTTSGTTVYDANGNPVVFKGVNWTGMNESWDGEVMTAADVAQAALWKANMVRVQLNEEFWNDTCQTDAAIDRTTYRNHVDQVVNAVTGAGMVALLDLHVTVRGLCDGYPDLMTLDGQEVVHGSTYPLPDLGGGVAFWSTVALRYRNNPLVAFELYNEPHPCEVLAQDANQPCDNGTAVTTAARDLWENGGQLTVARDGSKGCTIYLLSPTVPDTGCGYRTYTAAGMLQLYEAVRTVAPDSLVVIDGGNGATDPGVFNPGGPLGTYHMFPTTSTAYARHSYQNVFDCQGIRDGLTSFNNAPGVDSTPVIITEFGWPDPSFGAFTDALVNVADHGLANGRKDGWVGFDWTGPGFSMVDGYTLRVLGATGTAYPDLSDATASGGPVKAAMSGVYSNSC